ncbi:MAG TPA: farnesyl diphosphate synthase [Clostridia bacterium]|nr:farnesyl diphosphate synthase [Clostridia bacterium]
MNNNLVEQRINEYTDMVNKALDRYLPDTSCPQKDVCEAMRYSAMAGGKRIRPTLLLEFCKVAGGDAEATLPFACAVEMIHTYSLIHDDLPCMDNDDLRRGKPSCHIRFGEATALLAGDALLSLAFETALCNNYKGKIKPENALRAVYELARASGAEGMVGGQIIDLESEGHQVSLETLKFMHNKKTGAMITASARMGCILADAGENEIQWAAGYADNLGLAFQIVDDILDATSDNETLGKPVGSDEDNDKSTYITHLGIEKSKVLVQKLTDEAVLSLKGFGPKSEFLSLLAEALANRDR